MIKAVKDLYRTPDLTGAALTRPLQKYHWFFQGKINNPSSDGLTRGAWLAANIFTGIIIYPTFGIVAGVGMVVKLCGIPALKAHNARQLAQIETARNEYKEGRVYPEPSDNELNAPEGYDYRGFGYRANLRNYDATLKRASDRIRAHTSEFRRVTLHIVPSSNLRGQHVKNTFYVYTLEPVRRIPVDDGFAYASV